MDQKGHSYFWQTYLLSARTWTEREIFNFTERVSDYLDNLKQEPQMFRKSAKIKHTHIGVIVKQVSVVYRIKPRNKVIELIAFIDNRQGLKTNRY